MSIELQGPPIANSPPGSIFFTERPSATSTSPTVLCLHGLYSSHVEFAPVPFPPTYHLLTPDLPGHSASSHLPISLEATTASLANLIKSHGHGARAHVVGVSFGAYIALHLAATHPELVDSVFAIGCATPTSSIFGSVSWISMQPLLYFPSLFNWSLSWYGRTLSQELLADMSKNTTLALGNAAYSSLAEWSLKPITARTLVCAGGKGDMVRPLRNMEKVLKEGNNASRAGVARGMILAWDIQAPTAFAEAVVSWIEDRELPEFLVTLDQWFTWW